MYGMSQDRALRFAPVEQALRLSVGAASPFWLLYGSAAAAGLAFWSVARWGAEQAGAPLSAAALRLSKPALRVLEPETPVSADDPTWPSAAELAELTQFSGPVEVSFDEALTRPDDELAEEAAANVVAAPKPRKRKSPPTAH